MSAGQGLSLVGLALAWLGYGMVHSLLASNALKRWVERHAAALFPAYRLIYNAAAVLLLVMIALAGSQLRSAPVGVDRAGTLDRACAGPGGGGRAAGFFPLLRWRRVPGYPSMAAAQP